MKTIIAGSRSFGGKAHTLVPLAVRWSGIKVTKVISGRAKGVDRAGECYAIENDLPILKFPADWKRYGKKAGRIRNAVMAKKADALIAIWDGESNGTESMIEMAIRRGCVVYILTIKEKKSNKYGQNAHLF